MTQLLTSIYKILLQHYGALHWWPAETPYEVMVGAVLTQNTAWSNVEKALSNFDGTLSPQLVAQLDLPTLAEVIRPSGFFNQKAVYLKALTTWFAGYGYDVSTVQRQPLGRLRTELLATRGIGQETADSILLYAFDFPTFVVDAYTVRLCDRIPLDAGQRYMAIKTFFENHLPRSAPLFNNFHALIVIHAKNHCKKKPLCTDCPLHKVCRREGLPV